LGIVVPSRHFKEVPLPLKYFKEVDVEGGNTHQISGVKVTILQRIGLCNLNA
jgi:hypothetical protein